MEILFFCAAWCAPCRSAKARDIPELQDLIGCYELKVLDVGEYPAEVKAYNVSGLPTTVILRDGKEIARRVGTFSAQRLAAEVTRP